GQGSQDDGAVARGRHDARSLRLEPLALPVLGVPVPFEIRNQRGAEMALRLLARIDGAVAAEQIERLLGDAKRTAIADGADRARVGEAGDDPVDRRVHPARWYDLVADHAAFRAVAFEAAFVLNQLPRDTVADEADEPQIGQARDDAFLARGQRHVGVGRRQHVIDGQQRLAMATDGETLHGRDPRFLDTVTMYVVGEEIGRRHAAQQLVYPSQLALDEPHERNLSAIEMREVDPGPETAPAAIFRMIERAAA